jgi:hypothetical protein
LNRFELKWSQGGGGALDVALEHGNTKGVLAILRSGGIPQCVPSKDDGSCTLVEFASLNGFVVEAATCLANGLFHAVESDDANAGNAPPPSGKARLLIRAHDDVDTKTNHSKPNQKWKRFGCTSKIIPRLLIFFVHWRVDRLHHYPQLD